MRTGYGYAMVPENVPDEVASICEMFDGAFRSTIACAEVKKGEKILIVGAGPMGLTAAAAAVACGATVAVTDLYQNRLDKALEMGASFAYKPERDELRGDSAGADADLGPVDTACMCIALDRSRENDAFYLPVEALKENGRMTGLCVEVKLKDHNHWMNPFHLTRKNIKFRHNLERPGTVADFQRATTWWGGENPHGEADHPPDRSGRAAMGPGSVHNHPDQCIKVVVLSETV